MNYIYICYTFERKQNNNNRNHIVVLSTETWHLLRMSRVIIICLFCLCQLIWVSYWRIYDKKVGNSLNNLTEWYMSAHNRFLLRQHCFKSAFYFSFAGFEMYCHTCNRFNLKYHWPIPTFWDFEHPSILNPTLTSCSIFLIYYSII